MIKRFISRRRSFLRQARPISEQRTWTKFGLSWEDRFRTFHDLC